MPMIDGPNGPDDRLHVEPTGVEPQPMDPDDVVGPDETIQVLRQETQEVMNGLRTALAIAVAPSPPQPLERQVGGDHYQGNAIQPIEYILANGLDFCQGNVIKLVTRFRVKGGIEDLEKAKHYIDFMITQMIAEETGTSDE